MNLAKKLKSAREKKNYSQQDVALKLGISRQAISKWENSWTYPDIENLVLLSKLYEISLDDLLDNIPNVTQTEFDELEKEKINNATEINNNHKILSQNELLFLIVLALISCLIPFLGVAVSVWMLFTIFRSKYICTLMFKSIIIVCLTISLINTGIILNSLFFHIGKATII